MANDFVERILKKLFREKQESPDEEMPPVQEKLTRGDKFLYDFHEWRDSNGGSAVLSHLASLHRDSLEGSEYIVKRSYTQCT